MCSEKRAFHNKFCSYNERLTINFEEKLNIAHKALMFIKENGKYFFDASTNISLLAKALNIKTTIYTHSLDNIEILENHNKVELKAIGGYLNKRNRFFYDQNFSNYFKNLQFDAAFLGAAAIMPDGIYYDDEEDAIIKRAVVKNSKKVIILAEHQKYSSTSYFKGADWEDVDILIVDPLSVNSFVDMLKIKNIHIDPRILLMV